MIQPAEQQPTPHHATLSRREMLKLACAGYTWYELSTLVGTVESARHIGIEHHVFQFPTLPQEWDETYIVHFSDMHISARGQDAVNPETIRELSIDVQNYLQKAGAKLPKTFIFDTGDAVSVINEHDRTSIPDLAESLACLAKIPACCRIAVEGNHDVAHTQYPEIQELFIDHGYYYLGNPDNPPYYYEPIEGLSPFGVMATPDYTIRAPEWYADNRFEDIVANADWNESNGPLIWLTHNPAAINMWAGDNLHLLDNALILCGHTHGGQLTLLSPIQRLVMQTGYRFKPYHTPYIRGVHNVGTNIIGISPGIGQAGDVLRTVPPAVVIYELRS